MYKYTENFFFNKAKKKQIHTPFCTSEQFLGFNNMQAKTSSVFPKPISSAKIPPVQGSSGANLQFTKL